LDAHLKTKLVTLVNQKGYLTRKLEESESLLIDVSHSYCSCARCINTGINVDI